MNNHIGKIFLLYLTIILMGIFFCERIGHNLYTRGQELIVPRETSEKVLLHQSFNKNLFDYMEK